MCSSDQVDVTNLVIILWGLKTVNSGNLRYSEVLNLLLIQLFFFLCSFLDLCTQGFTCATPVPLSVSSSTTCDTFFWCSGLPLSLLTHSTHSQKLILVRPAANFLDSKFLI